MACSRPTFLLKEVALVAIASLSASTFHPFSPPPHILIDDVHLRLPSDFSKPIQIDLPISHAGAFVFWLEYDGEKPGERVKGHEGYFNIDPVLRTKARSPVLSDARPLPPTSGGVIRKDLINLPLDGLSILTVVSKWMGPISDWRKHFTEAKERGYTMLHYTPLQERGESDSPYSIRDQFKYDPSMFNSAQSDGGQAKVAEILKVARDEYGLLSLTDVVLNHTANDSPWLVEHPESGIVNFLCCGVIFISF